jgi:hypothetical protein
MPPNRSNGDAQHERRYEMESFESYTSVLTVLAAGLLLVVAGLGKKQLVWKAKPVPMRWWPWRRP